ncbi:bifunctional riboflavin kinase/FAD synthetase [Corynebacterium sp. CCM 9185]|uniref:Riboflavin biosynthesis protein n=1 Tax=Corynebacterium marambiense TaxID=2765364 RepID=A0ABS0VZD3_9CORY|nr:bifunctional riboflavin kinase/FAD synthetase [Corynebacterium marambiense]MBI9000687.1 bifunctional riboflavin kinase/FAD synthetase [Corynebacterium marambiense]MCK7663050.1 bifunctional riboflavin kinase/FAD synthetase [Corynebacterium marambiense]MCX7542664.1 bifunctional riboflavin kinase/FAD synthetase [Corynebacterium marambiense]
MDIWHGLEKIPADLEGSVVTIGVFDGVHRGHRRLIAAATRRARELGVPAVLMTFDPHPMAVFAPDKLPPMLGTVTTRADLARELGVDHMLVVPFTTSMAKQTPEEFVASVLVEKLRAAAVVVGENFTFGHRASGTIDTLRELGTAYGIEVDVQDLLTDDGMTVSSSVIRGLLHEGDVARANWALGRPFRLSGEVVRGAGRGGRELGYPTANLYFPDTVAIPADGVYCGWFTIGDDPGAGPVDGNMEPGIRYITAISVGTNPTFGDERRSVEAFVLDREADLYGRHCEIEFIEHLRGMETFNGVDDLLTAMDRDVRRTRRIMEAHRSDG